MIPIVQESETHVFFKLTMSHGILSRGTTRTDTHIFLQACMEGCAYVCVYMCWSDRLCYREQLVKLGQLWQLVNVYDCVGRYFDQASQIHITSSSVVIQLLVYDVHVEVKVEKWLLSPNIHTWIISCLSISTQTILKAKWCTQTSGQPGRCKWCFSVMLPPTGQISIELHEFVDGEAIWCSDLEGAGPGPRFWMCDKMWQGV